MSWNIEVTGASKTEALNAFNDAVDRDPNCEPKEVMKDVANVMTDHMGEEFVKQVRTYGHTNENGEHCNCAVLINC